MIDRFIGEKIRDDIIENLPPTAENVVDEVVKENKRVIMKWV